MAVDQRSAKARTKRIMRRERRVPPGAAPGTLVADPSAMQPTMELIAYGPDDYAEHAVRDITELRGLVGKHPVNWINVVGLADLELIRDLGSMFDLHRLALEDVINLYQRPKAEEYEDHVFIVTRMIHADDAAATEQVSMFLRDDLLLTFQERPGDNFEPVRNRLRGDRGFVRERKADYLAYALLDAVIDGYFPALEACGERLEKLEDSVIANPGAVQVSQIHELKGELLSLRRAIWPQREMINALTRESSMSISDQTRVYLRDCYDHTIQLMDLVETYREIAFGLIDLYLSSASARMNEIMKVLTVIATIFIPLSFITGLYGMNFDPDVSPWNMPELRWYWGYPLIIGGMAVATLLLLFYFYRKGWILERRRRRALRRGR